MRRRTNRASLLRHVLLAGLVAAFAPAAVGVAAAQEDDADKTKAEESAEEESAESSEAAQAAPAEEPTYGGNAAVPRPRKKVKIPTKIDPKTGKKVLVLTNDGLVEMFGEPAADLPSASVPYGTEGAEQAAAPGEAAPSAEDEKRMGEIKAEIRRLRSNLLRYRNPLLPRPEVTDDEKAEMRGKDNVQRIEMTKQRIAELEAEMVELERAPAASPSE